MNIYDDEKDKLLNHEYDGIRELDNHMPVWWLWLFYFTIGFGVLYMLYYEVFGWGMSQEEEYVAEMSAAETRYGNAGQNEAAEDFTWVFMTDSESIEAGKALYMAPGQLCFTCHGNEGQGLVGPNLTDDFWIHGCGPGEIANSIINGYPQMGMMPYGSGAKMSNEQIQQLASYIASLRGTNPPQPKAADMNRAVECRPE